VGGNRAWRRQTTLATKRPAADVLGRCPRASFGHALRRRARRRRGVSRIALGRLRFDRRFRRPRRHCLRAFRARDRGTLRLLGRRQPAFARRSSPTRDGLLGDARAPRSRSPCRLSGRPPRSPTLLSRAHDRVDGNGCAAALSTMVLAASGSCSDFHLGHDRPQLDPARPTLASICFFSAVIFATYEQRRRRVPSQVHPRFAGLCRCRRGNHMIRFACFRNRTSEECS